jgi:hypothetical protein
MSRIVELGVPGIYGIPPRQEAMQSATHGAVEEPVAEIFLEQD